MIQQANGSAEVAASMPSQVQLTHEGMMNMSSDSTRAPHHTTEATLTPSAQFVGFTTVCADAADLTQAIQSLAGLISMNQDANKPVKSAANSINALCDRIEDCLGKMSEFAETIDLQAQASVTESQA